MFRSNNCVAIHLTDVTAAENFYTNVMKFKLLRRTAKGLEYDTGNFVLSVCADLNPGPPVPGFTVRNIQKAREALTANGCTILREDERSLFFRDPFGVVYDVTEEPSETEEKPF
jgi:catechol 2,3-dioxygenase-like lactoylglutathione lyase family enzyme